MAQTVTEVFWVCCSSGELQGTVERIVPVHLNQSPPGMFPYFSQKSGIICNWGLVPRPMTSNTISDFQSSWLFPLFPSAGWKRDCQGKRKAWPNGPNTPGYSFLRNFSVPCVGPLFSVLECPFLRVGAWLRSIGGLCPTTCTADPLEKGSPTGDREDLSILKLWEWGWWSPIQTQFKSTWLVRFFNICCKLSSDLALWHQEKTPGLKDLTVSSCPSQTLTIAGTWNPSSSAAAGSAQLLVLPLVPHPDTLGWMTCFFSVWHNLSFFRSGWVSWISLFGFFPQRNWLHVPSCLRCFWEVSMDS